MVGHWEVPRFHEWLLLCSSCQTARARLYYSHGNRQDFNVRRSTDDFDFPGLVRIFAHGSG